MLINAQSPEEVRIAVLDDSTLENYQVEVAEAGLTRGNIYRGVIANLQPALDAAFVDYGVARNGFLSIQDVVPEARYREPKGSGRPRIDDILVKNKPIVVQVERDPEGQKGAILTTNLSFAGRYLVLTPFDATRGISRKVEDDETRGSLRELAAKLELPDGCGIIVRTNALDQTRAELNRDLAALLRVWKRVQQEATTGNGAKLLYSDQDLLLRALRDHLDSSVEEVLVDDDGAHERAREYMQAFMPRSKTSLVRYEERVPLFSKFSVESQIERIFGRTVSLPSGGAIVIDPTEALTAIDVNSGRSSGGGSHEDMALRTNIEAARETVRQLRLRDLGGLVVVDFIDMRSPKNRRAIEKEVKDGLKADKARSSVGRISSNGLLEINRQKIQRSLSARTHRPCPTCSGTGRVPSMEAIGLNLLRRIEGRAATGGCSRRGSSSIRSSRRRSRTVAGASSRGSSRSTRSRSRSSTRTGSWDPRSRSNGGTARADRRLCGHRSLCGAASPRRRHRSSSRSPLPTTAAPRGTRPRTTTGRRAVQAPPAWRSTTQEEEWRGGSLGERRQRATDSLRVRGAGRIRSGGRRYDRGCRYGVRRRREGDRRWPGPTAPPSSRRAPSRRSWPVCGRFGRHWGRGVSADRGRGSDRSRLTLPVRPAPEA